MQHSTQALPFFSINTSKSLLPLKICMLLIAVLLMGNFHPLAAQVVTPCVRFHTSDSPYRPYYDNLMSGFLQSASRTSSVGGFLQMPFVGDPALIYIGEKDTTQFMAYASTYQLQKEETDGRFSAFFKRYNIHADVSPTPAYCVQQYAFPDTLASKGFLLDIDNASSGAMCEDMDVVFLDRQTIRAYRRSLMPNAGVPDLYYVAHFSHPFHQWNIRREVVTLEDGHKEKRCKAAFIFDLRKGEKLTVKSYVSSLSTNDALARIDLKGAKFNVSDKRKLPPTSPSLMAQNNAGDKQDGKATTTSKTPPTTTSRSSNTASATKPSQTATSASNYSTSAADIIEFSTRDAELKAAFSIALSQMKKRATKKHTTDALAFIDFLTPLYAKADSRALHASVETTDSLVRQYAHHIFTGNQTQPSTEETAWFLFNAMGFVPTEDAATANFRLVRPMFNVVTLHLPRGRRFIVHCKRNSAKNLYIDTANMLRQEPLDDLIVPRAMLTRGGIMEVKMNPTKTHE